MQNIKLMRYCSQNGVKELIPSKDMHCLEGCHDALNSYAQLLKGNCNFRF